MGHLSPPAALPVFGGRDSSSFRQFSLPRSPREFEVSFAVTPEQLVRVQRQDHRVGDAATPIFVGVLHAGNNLLGEIQLLGATKVEKTSGVWVDGQYLGYLQELKGSKKIILLPGEHEIVVRQGGYLDFAGKIGIQPGEKKIISVTMGRDSRVQMPAVTAEIKLDVNPNRAAVFVDGVFIGHVAEFRALLVTPGKRRIIIKLPGIKPLKPTSNWWQIRSPQSRLNL